jgi:hypothetical protein
VAVKIPNKTKRTQRAKARRLAAEEARKTAARAPASREIVVKAERLGDMMHFTVRQGYFSPRMAGNWALYDLEIADAHDNPTALVECCMKAGIAVLSGILRTPILGVPGQEALKRLAQSAAQWMKLDVDELRKALEEERVQAADQTPPAADNVVTEPATAEPAPIATLSDQHPGT